MVETLLQNLYKRLRQAIPVLATHRNKLPIGGGILPDNILPPTVGWLPLFSQEHPCPEQLITPITNHRLWLALPRDELFPLAKEVSSGGATSG